jgi:5-methylcytosine-specific restriction endonuclease McrA
MPERYGKRRRRSLIASRARGVCEYCRCQVHFASEEAFSVEHILPRSLGGEDDLENLALACQACNNHKYTRTQAWDPETGKLVPLYHPRQQSWSDHFAWSSDFLRVVGRTATGRATVEALHLNREGLLNLRRILHKEGEHPPPEPEESQAPLGDRIP